MNRGLAHVAGGFVNGGLADDLFPLTPTLSLGEKERTLVSPSWVQRAKIPFGKSLPCPPRRLRRGRSLAEFAGLMPLCIGVETLVMSAARLEVDFRNHL